MIPSTSLLLLLLLGLCQALPLQEDIDEEEEDPDIIDVTTMILTTNKEIDENLLEGDLVAPTTKNAIICWYQNCMWEKSNNGLVMVPFTVSNDFTSLEKEKIDKAMQVYHSLTCIRFVPRKNDADYISIEDKGGCYSYLGRVGGKQVVSLRRKGCIYHGVIQHEINHALGFQHEQNRSDRDKYVKINWANVNPNKAYNFYRQYTNNLNTPYDYSSIMHYGRTAFTINKGQETITPIPDPNVQIGQRKEASFWDIERVNLLYNCN